MFNTNITETFEAAFKDLHECNLISAYMRTVELQKMKKEVMLKVLHSEEYDQNFVDLYFAAAEDLVKKLDKKINEQCLTHVESVEVDRQTLTSEEKQSMMAAYLEKMFYEILLSRSKRFQAPKFTDILDLCEILREDLNFVVHKIGIITPGTHEAFIKVLYSFLEKFALKDLSREDIKFLIEWAQKNSHSSFLGASTFLGLSTVLNSRPPLISQATTDSLYSSYISKTKQSVPVFLKKTIREILGSNELPYILHENNEKIYSSDLPTTLIILLNGIVDLPQKASEEVIKTLNDAALYQLTIFFHYLNDGVVKYKTKNFAHRKLVKNFTSILIMVSNDAYKAFKLIEEHYSGNLSVQKEIKTLKSLCKTCLTSVILALIDELMEDIQSQLNAIMTRGWLATCDDCLVICDTIDKFYNEYQHLRSINRYALLETIIFKLAGGYIIGLKCQRLKFFDDGERSKAATRLREDVKNITDLFSHFQEKPGQKIPGFLNLVAELFDRQKAVLESSVIEIVEAFPDIPTELLTAIICSRGDFGMNESRKMVFATKKDVAPTNDSEMINFFESCEKPIT
uniref:Exocyst complex component Sec6 n=1 Tax=Panagrolaimus sp. ES5 TaxID=591445 RepID=A0AC34G297_9BILA